MNFNQKAALSLLCAVAVLFLTSVQGFGQTKFYTVDDPIPGQYIVVLEEAELEREADIPAIADAFAHDYSGTVGFIYEDVFKGFSVEMSEEDAISLSLDSQVKYVSEDNLMYLTDTQTSAPWNLDRIDQRDLPLDTTYTYGNNGAGVTAYIIDTGIRAGHNEFGSRASVGADFVGGSGVDCNGHGTHVAGTVGGTTYGVAKGVTLVAVRVFGCGGSSPSSTIIAGINWVSANHASRAVANMSLGGGANQATDDAVRNLVSSGVVGVVAAGNDNADAYNTSPARVKQALTVGAIDNTDTRASFSNYGNSLDVFAPGVSVTSAWYDSNSSANTISGTSMATPHVAGAAALLLYGSGTVPTPAEIQNLIVANAGWGKVSSRGTASPNTLLFVGSYSITGNLKAWYQYYDSAVGGHFYAEDWSEIGAGVGYNNVEKIRGVISSTNISGTTALYRYYNSILQRHHYTTDYGELGGGGSGWTYEGIPGYVYTGSGTGRLALYRYYNSYSSDYYYTTDYGELGSGGSGWVYEGIECYVIAP